MSYQVLARKWRPGTFREMVGQEHVLKALINALDHDRLHHAYLFTGTRGVGKTTVARIFAKSLNCEQGVSSVPCGECASCREIAEGRSVDLIEVDAASRTKVEDTRELLENVQYAPTRCRYKVYLIDEVHMLSTHSFNALLKTLEEPPPHVKFLLATTDPQKLPVTVLSRCLQFNLKNMLPEVIVAHLKNVLEAESVAFEEPALWLLARAATGSMRDALSLTDQAIAFGSGQLGEQDVREMLGTVDLVFVYALLEAVAAQDAAAALKSVENLSQHAPDYPGALQELVGLLHRVAVAQTVPEAVDNSWGDAQRVQSIAASISPEDAQLYYQIGLNGRRDLPFAADMRSGLEMTLLRMIAFRPGEVLDAGEYEELVSGEDAEPVKKPEAPSAPVLSAPEPAAAVAAQAFRSEPPSTPPVRSAPQEQQSAPSAKPPSSSFGGSMQKRPHPEPEPEGALVDVAEDVAAKAVPAVATKPVDPAQLFEPGRWADLLDTLKFSGVLQNVASNCELRQVEGDKAYLVLDEANGSLYNSSVDEKIASALSQLLGREIHVHVEIGSPRQETPAARAQRLLDERLAQAVVSIEQDPRVKLLLDTFAGTLDRDSITPIKH
ncbi:DNA polymerase III subunit gamma/tau [Halieaceae bacterium IMCC14734]|uniref:DNA polymerase III subunit gamma/tau n=1 Tax=Candidatus Litorirhabdus singularis TaxID=2518993 RepID=A0ABT3TGX2_9GAMM|nr:DNA polymerase III subunit gamma/tau [Candidatus Litorirhabdus singularis]MCX2981450.1 DNA polymerase III subunit gamma/tau [Candidatus Litorirhabdus singularis]